MATTFPLPELGTIPQNELDLYSLPAMLSALVRDEEQLNAIATKAAMQGVAPALDALQFGAAAAGPAPQASPYTGPIDPVQARVQGGLNTAAGGPERGPALAGPQSPYPPQAQVAPAAPPAPSFGERLTAGLEGLAGASDDIAKLAGGGPPASVTPQARNFVSQGGPSPRSGPIVPGPNAQSSAYLQSLLQLLRGNRYGQTGVF